VMVPAEAADEAKNYLVSFPMHDSEDEPSA
jgi:hypothetical protein